ncbi:MAG: CRTAC1 family protein [Nannocystaceae bacterium]|nr:CRTAC1 family protein [bacterium]
MRTRRAWLACLGPVALTIAATACESSSERAAAPSEKQRPAEDAASLQTTAEAIVAKMRALEVGRDVTCWTSFRQLDTFISSKAYSDFATLARVMASKALTQSIWAAASAKASGEQVSVADIESVFSIEAELDEARKAELQKFAEDQGWQQFRDYRTTSEHWRVMLSVVQDELARPEPELKPLGEAALEHLALASTRIGLALLEESGQIATEARTPFIEAEHVRKAYAALLERYDIPTGTPQGTLDHARANAARIPLTKALIDAKVHALRAYNSASSDLTAELNKVSSIPFEAAAVEQMVGELRSMAGFFARGYDPMRGDNYLADGNFAPARLQGRAYIDAQYVENATAQIWPYVMLPNGDVKMRFEPRPGNLSTEDLEGQDVTLLDHQMNAVRDTALHWVVLREEWDARAFAMDPFAAEYLSELISIVATFYIRRAQTLARAQGAPAITAAHIGQVRDNRFVATMPNVGEAAPAWDEDRKAAKATALAPYTGPLLVDATAAWGLAGPDTASAAEPGDADFEVQAAMGSGIAVGDFDADGFVDVFLAQEGNNRLYRNRKGKGFEDVTAATLPESFDPAAPDVRGSLFVDIDGDADADLVVLRSRSASMVFRNEGGTFVDATAQLGFTPGMGAHVLCAFDYEDDGDLDLYVGFYGSATCNEGACTGRNLPSMDGQNGKRNHLYRNDGARWTEVAAAAGIDDPGWTLAASTFDHDGDGHLDLALANDFGANPMYRSRGDGTFENVASALGADDRGSGMNVSFADVDGNGTLDMFVSNIDMFSKNIKVVFPSDTSQISLGEKILQSFEYLSGNKLYLNVLQPSSRPGGKPRRRFVAAEREWFEPGDQGWAWAGLFFDLDNDGDEDFYLTNGWIPQSPAADQPNALYIRDGSTYYAAPAGDHAFAGNSRAAVSVDLDNDGDLDLLVTNLSASPRVLLNQADRKSDGHWLMLRPQLQGRGAVGTQLEIETPDGTVQRRLVTAGEGYLGQREPRVHVGLGKAETAEVRVTWPDGSKQRFEALEADAVHDLRAGER